MTVVDFKDLKPGDRFRVTETRQHTDDSIDKMIIEADVTALDAYGDGVEYGEYGEVIWACGNTDTFSQVWERLTIAEPTNLGTVVEFHIGNSTIRVVRSGLLFKEDSNEYSWNDILELDPNPRVLHAGWDGP